MLTAVLTGGKPYSSVDSSFTQYRPGRQQKSEIGITPVLLKD